MSFKKSLPWILIVTGSGILLFFGYIFTLIISMGKNEGFVNEFSATLDKDPVIMAIVAGVLVVILVSIFTAVVMIYAAVNLLRFPDKKWTFKELVGLV